METTNETKVSESDYIETVPSGSVSVVVSDYIKTVPTKSVDVDTDTQETSGSVSVVVPDIIGTGENPITEPDNPEKKEDKEDKEDKEVTDSEIEDEPEDIVATRFSLEERNHLLQELMSVPREERINLLLQLEKESPINPNNKEFVSLGKETILNYRQKRKLQSKLIEERTTLATLESQPAQHDTGGDIVDHHLPPATMVTSSQHQHQHHCHRKRRTTMSEDD